MSCPLCQTHPCEVLSGDLSREAVWLFSEEAEQVLTSGEWRSLFEHLTEQVSILEEATTPTTRKKHTSAKETMTMQTQQTSALPSQETGVYWLWAHCQSTSSQTYDTEKVGKWLVFVPVERVDTTWARIKQAVEQGRLGKTAKVATAKRTALQASPAERVICVYTDDWTDEYDVRRIHAELYDLGCTWPMSYKTDQDTLAGIYRHTGHTRIGVYRFGPQDALAFKAGTYEFLKVEEGEQSLPPPPLRLTIDLVPRSCWHSNMRQAVSRPTWDALRKQVYAHYNYCCGICQARGQLSCHEIWHYDDDQHVQILEGFIALCTWCHHVKHLGLAGILAREGKLNYNQVVTHFLTVNACRLEDFREHRRQMFAQWRGRNRYEWRTDLGAYAYLVP